MARRLDTFRKSLLAKDISFPLYFNVQIRYTKIIWAKSCLRFASLQMTGKLACCLLWTQHFAEASLRISAAFSPGQTAVRSICSTNTSAIGPTIRHHKMPLVSAQFSKSISGRPDAWWFCTTWAIRARTTADDRLTNYSNNFEESKIYSGN